MTFRIITYSSHETQQFGRKLGRRLRKGDTVLLRGHLGAGKTTLVQGLIRGLKVKEAALSPTFVVAQTLKGRVPVHHLDFYRKNCRELLAMGIQDYLAGGGEIEPGVVLIEWADRCRSLWPADRLDVSMKARIRPTERTIVIRAGKGRALRLLRRLKKLA